jgi:UrcA family protein
MRPTCDEAYTRLNDTRDGRKRYEVCYADLTPVTIATADDIYGRIADAARKACRGGSSLFSMDRSCRRDAIYRAVVDVNLPALDSYYANKSGRYVPRVTVGPLRRN